MKSRIVPILAWLAVSGWAAAQPSQPGAPASVGSVYGAGPSTPPQMFQTPPTPLSPQAAANATTNSTANSNNAPITNLGGNLPSSSIPQHAPAVGNATTPGANANETLNPAMPANAAMPAGPDLSSFPMPATMDNIDNDHQLAPGDQIVIQIVEDREPPQPLLVDEKGMITVPWINTQEPVDGETLRTAANQIKELLGNSTLQYYKDGHPTVLATYYHNDNSRGRVYVIGAVQKPGYVPIPAYGVLTLWDAIQAALGFRADADQTNVLVIHHDANDSSKITRTPVDVAGGLKNGQPPTMPVQPGDFISVSSKDDTSGSVTISGKGVSHPGVIPLTGDGKLTVSKAILQAGWDNFSKLTDVHINRIKRDPKTGAPIIDPKTGTPEITVINVDVDEIINKGNAASKDVPLEKDDWIVVDQRWFVSPF